MKAMQSIRQRMLAITLIACLIAGVLPSSVTTVVAADSGIAVAKLVADNHVLMLRADGRLLVWGDNRFGQLGLGKDAPEIVYEPIEHPFFRGKNIRDVAVGEDCSYVLLENGELYSFGKGADGRLGLGGEGNILTPTLIAGSPELRINAIHAGKGFVIAETDMNALYGWGLNDKGQLGIGNTTNVLKPTRIMENADVKELYVGADFVILIKQDNSYWCWGNNDKNQWGVNRLQLFKTSTWGPGNQAKCTYHKYGEIDYSDYISNCMYYYKYNNTASQSYTTYANVPTTSATPVRFDNVGVSEPTTVKCQSGGTVSCGTFQNYTNAMLHNVGKWSSFKMGSIHGFVCIDDIWYGWGDNTYKQLGTTGTDNGVPKEQDYLNKLVKETLPQHGLEMERFLVFGDTNIIITKTNGIYTDQNKVYGWGSNLSGKLGLNSTQSYYASPTEIPALEELDIIDAKAGRNTVYYISSTGSVYAAGDNLYGQSGLGVSKKDTVRIAVPTEIPIKFSETAEPPAPPAKVKAPVEAEAGNTVTVEWDEVDDAVSYELTRTVAYSSGEIVQQSVDGDISAVGAAATSSQVIYNGPNTQYVDKISPDWESIMYSVRALNYIGDYSPAIVTGNIRVKIPTTPAHDTTPPTVTIVPDATKAQVTIFAEDTGSGVEGIYINGTRVATNVYTYKLSSGETISIYAKDKAGNVSSTRTISYNDVVSGGGGSGGGSGSGGMTTEQLLALIAALQKDSNNSNGLTASDIARLIGDSSGTDSLTPVLMALLAQQPSNSTGNNDQLMAALLQMALNQQSRDVNFNITLPAELAAFLPQTQRNVGTPTIIFLVILSVAMLGIVVLAPLYIILGKKQHSITTDVEELEYQHNLLVKDFNCLVDENNAVHAENTMLREKLQAMEKQ